MLSRAQRRVLEQYKDTSDARFMQVLPGASELESLGLLQWRGEQYGMRFYSITPAGRRALANPEGEK